MHFSSEWTQHCLAVMSEQLGHASAHFQPGKRQEHLSEFTLTMLQACRVLPVTSRAPCGPGTADAASRSVGTAPQAQGGILGDAAVQGRELGSVCRLGTLSDSVSFIPYSRELGLSPRYRWRLGAGWKAGGAGWATRSVPCLTGLRGVLVSG